MNCQIVHDSIHRRPGWTREYALELDGATVGFGSVAIAGPWRWCDCWLWIGRHRRTLAMVRLLAMDRSPSPDLGAIHRHCTSSMCNANNGCKHSICSRACWARGAEIIETQSNAPML